MGKNQKNEAWSLVCDMREEFLLALSNAMGEPQGSLHTPGEKRNLESELNTKEIDWFTKGPDLSDSNDRMLWHVAKAVYANARLRKLLIEKTN